MAASSRNVRIELEIDEIPPNHELKVFHGHAVNESSSISYSGRTAKVSYSGYLENADTINAKMCIFGIYLLERATNEKGLPCMRIQGNIHFEMKELIRKQEKGESHFRKEVKNHVLDDEIKENFVLQKKEARVLAVLEGDIQIIDYPQNRLHGYRMSNADVYKECIVPWYEAMNTHTSGPINPVIKDYNVPWMRFVTGPMIPFSASMFWRNRYYDNFERDPSKCANFVGLIYGLLNCAVDLYPEFSNIEEFFHECKSYIERDDFSKIGLSCINVIMDIFILKSVSEPYVTDRVSLRKSGQQIHVDQFSALCHIYGSDCEDGQKYAYELNKLISNSDWNLIISTLNNDSNAVNINATVVKILRMTVNFCTTMFCGSDICHSINVLVDTNTVKSWLGMDAHHNIKANEETPLKRIKEIKTFFIESTRYSVPFQNRFSDDDHHGRGDDHDRRVKIQFQTELENEFDRVSEVDVADYSGVPNASGNISEFYRYFTALATEDLQSINPGVYDYLPISHGNLFGISLNDIHFHPDIVSIKPRIRFSNYQISYFDESVNGHHPNYDLEPARFRSMTDLFSRVSQIDRLMPARKRIKSFNYVKINVFIVGILRDVKQECEYLKNIISKIRSRQPQFTGFDYKIRQLYNSPQSYIFVLYLYYA